MKYRRLSFEELQELQPEFIQFLAGNTITAEEWELLKKEDPAKAARLLDIFSDLVFDKILEDIEFLEFKTSQDIKTFCFMEEKVLMLGLYIEGNTAIDFTKNHDADFLLQTLQESGANLKLYSAEKNYSDSKKAEAFTMLENGALISRDGRLYKALENLKP